VSVTIPTLDNAPLSGLIARFSAISSAKLVSGIAALGMEIMNIVDLYYQ
jgi:hypothetical protein